MKMQVHVPLRHSVDKYYVYICTSNLYLLIYIVISIFSHNIRVFYVNCMPFMHIIRDLVYGSIVPACICFLRMYVLAYI